MHDDAHHALASFPNHEVRRTVRSNDRNAVHEVVVDGRRAALKTTDSQPALLAREAAVARRVGGRTSVPVPEILDEDEGVLLLAWADGEEYDPTDPVERRRARLRAAGRTLARIHRDTADWFDGHGTLEPRGGSLAVADPTPWHQRLAGFLDEWAAALDPRDADVADAVREFVSVHRDAFAGADPVLVHGEPAPDHLRYDGTDVSAVVDWEIAQAAPGEFDLAWAEREFFESPFHGESDGSLRKALRRGYDAERSLPVGSAFRRRVYRAAFTMRALKHADATAERADLDAGDLREAMRSHAFGLLDVAESVASLDGGVR